MKNKYEIKRMYKETQINYFCELFKYRDFRWAFVGGVIIPTMLSITLFMIVVIGCVENQYVNVLLMILTIVLTILCAWVMKIYINKYKKGIVEKYMKGILAHCKKRNRSLSKYGYKKEDFKEIWDISNLRFRFVLEDKGYIPIQNVDVALVEKYREWFPEYKPFSVGANIMPFCVAFISGILAMLFADDLSDRHGTIIGMSVIWLIIIIMMIYVLVIARNFLREKCRTTMDIRNSLNNIVIEVLIAKQREREQIVIR